MMALLPILSAKSASSPMYSSPTNAGGGRRACSSKGLPSPPSRMTYSIPKWLCKISTLSRNQLVASGLVMLSFTLYFPFHWVNRGTWKRDIKNNVEHTEPTNIAADDRRKTALPVDPVVLKAGSASSLQCLLAWRFGTAESLCSGTGRGWWKCLEALQKGCPWYVS